MSFKMLVSDLGEGVFARLREAAPEAEFLIAHNKEEALKLAPEADAAYGFASPDVIASAPRLKWIQASSAGVERAPFGELRARGIVFTNASGVYGAHLADHTMALILAFSRQLPILIRAQLQGVWTKRTEYPSGELTGQTLLIDGLGGTGEHLARRAAGFDMRVIATRRHPDRSRPAAVEAVYPHDGLHDLLPEADWVAVCLPLTPDTRDRYHDREFELMKPTACITNIARGAIINTQALMRALDAGQIAGAGLDVTDPEPLPAGHPLWAYENVIITPHASGHSPHANARMMDLLCENLRRFAAGEGLRNVVHLDLEY